MTIFAAFDFWDSVSPCTLWSCCLSPQDAGIARTDQHTHLILILQTLHSLALASRCGCGFSFGECKHLFHSTAQHRTLRHISSCFAQGFETYRLPINIHTVLQTALNRGTAACFKFEGSVEKIKGGKEVSLHYMTNGKISSRDHLIWSHVTWRIWFVFCVKEQQSHLFAAPATAGPQNQQSSWRKLPISSWWSGL